MIGNAVFLTDESDKGILTKSFYDQKREVHSYRDTLPYGRLGGDGFERLCYLILLNENRRCVPHFFGRQGQADFGADLTLQDEKGAFTIYQCKNWSTKDKLSVKAFADIFDKFNKQWVGEQELPKPERYILCTSKIIGKDKSTHKAFKLSKAAFEKRFKDQWGQSILIEFWDGTTLDDKLKKLPDIVADIFGDEIAGRHCGFMDWNAGIFIPVNENCRNTQYLKEYFKRQDKIYIPDDWSAKFFETLREHKKILIKGFPGSGKTTISLALSRNLYFGDREAGKQYYVYYVNFKSHPSLEELRKGIERRSFLPSVFVFDDCQRELEDFKALSQSILDMYEDKNVFFIFLYRTPLVEDKKSIDDIEIEELFKEKKLELEVKPSMFKEIVEMVKPGLWGIDIDDLYDFTGHDLFILDFVLQSIESPADFEKIKNSPEELYKKVVRKYFNTETGRFKAVLKIASLAQFDIGIHPDYFKEVTRDIDIQRKKILRELVVKAGRPFKYFFLHTSLAELICRAAFYISGTQGDFVKEVAANAVEYFMFLSAADASNEEFNQDLNNFLFNGLKMYRDSQENRMIKSHFLGSEEILHMVREKIKFIYPNLIGKILVLSGSNGVSGSYYNILKEKVEDGSYIDVLVSFGNIATGLFLSVLKSSYPDLFLPLKSQFDGDKLKRLCEDGDFQSLIKLLSSFFTKEDSEQWDNLLETLDKGIIDDVIDRTIEGERSIGTINMGFRELKANGLLSKLEEKIGAFNYLRLIENNGTYIELILFLRDSTTDMANALIAGLTEEWATKIIDKTIVAERSIGTINLGLRELEQKGLLEKLEEKIGAFNYLRLIENNGTFFELIRVLQHSTESMANALIAGLTEEWATKIIDKTIVEGRSIGTINLGFRELGDIGLLEKLEGKIGAFNYLRLIEKNGTFIELIRFLQYSTDSMKNAMMRGFSADWMSKLIDKTITQKSPIKRIHWDIKTLKSLCSRLNLDFEGKIGTGNIIKLTVFNGNPGLVPNLLDTFSENQKRKLIETFSSLSDDEKENFIFRGHFSNLCYGLEKCPQLPIFSSFDKTCLEQKAPVIKILVEQSNFKSISVGLGCLEKYPNKNLAAFLREPVISYIDSLDREHIPFDSNGEKINYLLILNRLERLDNHTIENILNTIDEEDFSEEIDFIISLRLLRLLLGVYDVDPRWRQKILDLSNSDKIVKALEKEEKLINVFLYLWNTYALFRTANPGRFDRWINPVIVTALMKLIDTNVRAKQGADEYGQLLMLIGLLDYFRIASDPIRDIFLSSYYVNLANSFLNRELESCTFIPGFFYLKGVEFLIERPVYPNIWKKLVPKIDDYKDKRPKALKEIIEIVQKI